MGASINLNNIFSIHQDIHHKEVNKTLCSDASCVY